MHFWLLSLATLAFCVIPVEGREIIHRIALKPQKERVIAGRIPTPDDVVVYRFEARAGQHISIRLEPAAPLIAQTQIVPPSGKALGPGAELDAVLDESGTFQIRVIPRERSSGTFRLHLILR